MNGLNQILQQMMPLKNIWIIHKKQLMLMLMFFKLIKFKLYDNDEGAPINAELFNQI